MRLRHALLVAMLSAACSRSPQARESAFLKSAQKHVQAQDFGRAILDLKNAAEAMPSDPVPHYQMGLAYVSAGNLPDAARELRRSLELNPNHIPALLKFAEILISAGNPPASKQGQEQARTALALAPGNPDALQLIASAEVRQGDAISAVQHLQQALANSPGHLKSALTLAAIRMKENDLSGAEQVLKQAADSAPQSAEHAVTLGQFYLQGQRFAEAKEEFERALRIDPACGPALVNLAALAKTAGDPAQASRLLAKAAALPDKAYRSVHASFLLETGEVDAAIAEFEKLYRHDQANRDVRTRLVAAYLRTGRLANAEKMLAPVLAKDPRDFVARLQRAEMRLASGKVPDAETDAAAALAVRPDSAEAHLLMARIHRDRNDLLGYRRELNEVLRIDPRLLAARIELAHSLTTANAGQTAVELLDAALPEDQHNPALIVERNTALYALGRYADMRKSVDQGLAAAPHDPDLLLEDGVLRLKQHDIGGGRASLEAALKWRADDWRALEALAMSYVAERMIPEATAAVREYTSRVPNSIAAQQFLAAWLARAGDVVGARLALQTARSLAPPGSKAAFAADQGIAELDLREANLDSARGRLLALIKTQPGDVAVIMDLAFTEIRAGRWDSAIGYYEEAVRLEPANLPALNNLAFLLADMRRNPQRGLALAQRAEQFAPDDPSVNDTLGWAYYCNGDYPNAVKYLNLSKTPTARWKCHLAMAYLKTGNRRQAAALLEAALKQDPSLPEAKKVQSLLEAR